MTDQTEADPSETRVRGAQPGNRNSVRHGLRMTSGRMPDGCKYIAEDTAGLRRLLEQGVMDLRKRITTWDALMIQNVVRLERHARLCERLLRLKADEMAPDAIARLSEAITKASCERDKYILALGLDATASSTRPPWEH
jgi:hypothetical protein